MLTIPPLLGKYQILRLLGHGGMGTVYLARDPVLDRTVAIKMIRAELDSPEIRERFLTEARTVSRLRHPNLVTVFEYAEFQGHPYFVMEYIEGETLAALIDRREPLPLSRKLQLIDEVCAGVVCAHRAHLVHRDLKPANVMVDAATSLIRVLDFGIARSLDARLSAFTRDVGTPGYMAPEQLLTGRVDRRSDVFAIGAICYELVSHRPAFYGDSYLAIANMIAHAEPRPLLTLCPGLDVAVIRIVTTALQKDPKDRYQNLDELRRDLQLVLRPPVAAGANPSDYRCRRCGRSSLVRGEPCVQCTRDG